MCGIAGIYNYKSKDISDAEFDVFLDSLEHRGPDGRGVYKDKDVFFRFGHRRLSILDLSEYGRQPMSYMNGRYWISFNGEIYNFLELKNELIALGYSFRTDSDTEVILVSYMHWKEECQLKFNGMWAFAIWDSEEKKLFLSRDRFGIKPLLYYLDNNCLVFASELKSFNFLKQLNTSFDEQMIANTLVNANIWEATPNTILKNVKNLCAGHFITFDCNKKITIKKWWNTLDHLVEIPFSSDKIIEKFKDLFFDACLLRMRSDVPIASALSGGLDSSSVVCSIFNILNDHKYNKYRLISNRQKVFIATFFNTSQDEYFFAKNVVDHTNAQAHCYEINEDQTIKNIDKVIYDFESIFDPPIGPWHIYKEFRKNKHVISIDGHGADELLGGYHHHPELLMHHAIESNNLFAFRNKYKLLSSLYIRQDLNPHHGMLKLFLKNKINRNNNIYKFLKKIKDNICRINNSGISAESVIPRRSSDWLLIEPKYFDVDNDLKNNEKFHQLDFLSQILYKDFHYHTLPVILRNFDRSSMAHGVEIRSPFLDWRLVAFLFSLNQKYKIDENFTKLILRKSMKEILPENIRKRKTKIGFANPIYEWFENGLKSFIYDNLNSKSFLQSNIWDGKKIMTFVENCYKTKNYKGIYSFWLCIVANRLMTSFSEKRNNFLLSNKN